MSKDRQELVQSTVGQLEDQLSTLTAQTQIWLESGVKQGVISKQDWQEELAKSADSARDLFTDQTRRPLVVGLFGGTGVGKSSLMNRFAQDQVARTGVERPTSREVTVYLHESYELKQLPKDFPIDRVNIRQHHREPQRDMMWIDMPDIDSVETQNAEMVKAWLPFVDVIIYVVSPDRYRDARGWEYLRDQGYEHAWLFVMNQWDLIEQSDVAERAVMDDFQQLLARAGFEQPKIFHTDCLKQQGDAFSDLEAILSDFSHEHSLAEIESRGLSRRAEQLIQYIERINSQLGSEDAIQSLNAGLEKDWQTMTDQVDQHLSLHFQQVAKMYLRPERSLRARLLGQAESTSIQQTQIENDHSVWDQRATLAMQDVVSKLLQNSDQLGLPAKAFQTRLGDSLTSIADRMPTLILQSMRTALAKPGRFWQRFGYTLMRYLSILLPIAALIWVGWRVVSVYYEGQSEQYFGLNFAIHSGMLVLLAWAVPAFLKVQLQPSMEEAALRGLQSGLQNGLTETRVELQQQIDALDQMVINFRETGEQLSQAIKDTVPQVVTEKQSQLADLWQRKKV